jgi:hypothetical protein
MEDGGRRMEEGGWRMEDGRWRMEDGGWRMEDGGWGRREGGRRKEEGGGKEKLKVPGQILAGQRYSSVAKNGGKQKNPLFQQRDKIMCHP